MAWWDFGLRIKALAKKEAVIYYGSEEIKRTIARLGNKNYELAEKVRMSQHFSQQAMRMKQRQLWRNIKLFMFISPKNMYLFNAMKFASGLNTEYENSMYHRFENNVDMKYSEKLYENEYAVIYRLKI
ncbi:MAG TPA: hypothetical protein ENG66_01325 [Thermococcus sp.]|nr:hypothetical protein [Thermococcus sp.]